MGCEGAREDDLAMKIGAPSWGLTASTSMVRTTVRGPLHGHGVGNGPSQGAI